MNIMGYGQVVAVSTSCGVLKETKSHGYENVKIVICIYWDFRFIP